MFCGFTHIDANWVDADLEFTPQWSRKIPSDFELRKDGKPKLYIACRAGCGLHKSKQIFRFHDCLRVGVQIRGHPMIPKTMFNGSRIKNTENWNCAKSHFRDSIIHVTQTPPSAELMKYFDDTVPKPTTGVSSAAQPVPQADMRNALNAMRKAKAKRKREEEKNSKPSYAQQAAKSKNRWGGPSSGPGYKKPGWTGTLIQLTLLISINN